MKPSLCGHDKSCIVKDWVCYTCTGEREDRAHRDGITYGEITTMEWALERIDAVGSEAFEEELRERLDVPQGTAVL